MREGRRLALRALGAAFLAPLPAFAQKRRRVVVVHFDDPKGWGSFMDDLRRSLAQLGFADGREIGIRAEGIVVTGAKPGPESVARQIREQVLPLEPDVIVTTGAIMSYVMSLATRTVPVVAHAPDPVAAGFAKSVARPGGNFTGLADGLDETAPKSVEILRRLVPRAKRVAVFHEPRPVSKKVAAYYEKAARDVGLEPVMIASTEQDELLAALRGLPARRIDSAIWMAFVHPRKVAEAALAARVPVIGQDHEGTRFGCLASYAGYEPDPVPKLARAVAQILRGANPGDIPFQLPQQFRFAINRRTAGALGIVIPADLLVRADTVFDDWPDGRPASQEMNR
ncbi:MAG: ABC transporter substrate-binding protein [Lysobacter sp.]|nr:ABC transporter substrate-binding protein [Lysobacter sp.]